MNLKRATPKGGDRSAYFLPLPYLLPAGQGVAAGPVRYLLPCFPLDPQITNDHRPPVSPQATRGKGAGAGWVAAARTLAAGWGQARRIFSL